MQQSEIQMALQYFFYCGVFSAFSSLILFFNIFICPFNNSENSLVILSCAQERQFVWLFKHKHTSLIYYTNKYWRIPAFYLVQFTEQKQTTLHIPWKSGLRNSWSLPCSLAFIQPFHFYIVWFQTAGLWNQASGFGGTQPNKSETGNWLCPPDPFMEKG